MSHLRPLRDAAAAIDAPARRRRCGLSLAQPTHWLICAQAGLKGQPAEDEMRRALIDGEAVVLFPSDDAAPASELSGHVVDVVVIDGTWEQAQKLNARLPGRRAKLDEDIVEELSKGEGRQLRSHPTAWREVGTLAATRHFLGAIGVSSAPVLADYQAVADAAARRQLGPPRLSPKRH